MKNIHKITSAAIIAMSMISCSAISDLEDRLDALEARVKAIENILPTLNGNIEALMNLSNKNSIVSVESVNGRYKLTLANGEVINITQGSIGTSNAPLLSIDKNGYWMVDYQDGNGASYIKCGNDKVKAVGTDGITPEFGVSEEGFWTVSYDEGTTWETVKDVDGNPVSAIPSEGADEYFEDVRLEGDTFIVVLKNGERVEIPVVPDFMFVINGSAGIIGFGPGELKSFKVVSKGIATASIITKPAGWTVNLTEGQLIVLAPKAESKATADTDTDISVLAVSGSGHAVLSKVRVKLTE